MKKVIIFALLLILTVSCTCNRDQSQVERSQPIQEVYVRNWGGYIQTVEYNGHRYILATRSTGYGEGCSIIHDPDCNCFKK